MSQEAKPRGRESVQAALIDAGARLFAERGPSAVSVRDVAKAAGVNHGLVHRHFGSKDGLLRAVIGSLAERIAQNAGAPQPDESLGEALQAALGATGGDGAYWRILARSLLDGADPAELQDSFPVAQRMLAAARRTGTGEFSPEAVITLGISAGLGYLLFSPYARKATGQDDAQWHQTRQELWSLVAQLAQASSSPTR